MTCPSRKIAGILFFIASSQLALCLVVAEALHPGYSVSSNYVSDLGIGPASAIFNSSIFLLGLLTITGVYFLPRDINFRALTILLALMAIGAMGAGVFTKDFALIHGVISSVAFLFAGLSAIISFRVSKVPFSAASVMLGLISLGASALFAGGIMTNDIFASIEAQDSVFFLGIGPGGMERMIVYPALLWLAGFGGHLIALPEQEAKWASADAQA